MQIIPIMPIETMFGMVNRRAGYLLTFCLFLHKIDAKNLHMSEKSSIFVANLKIEVCHEN